MRFDLKASRDAGYDDEEIAEFLAKEFGLDIAEARDAGYTPSEIVSFFDKQAATPKMPRGEEHSDLVKRMGALEAMLKALGTAIVAATPKPAEPGMSESEVKDLLETRLKDRLDAVMQQVRLGTSISTTLAAAARDGRRAVKHVGSIGYDKFDRIVSFEITPVYKD